MVTSNQSSLEEETPRPDTVPDIDGDPASPDGQTDQSPTPDVDEEGEV